METWSNPIAEVVRCGSEILSSALEIDKITFGIIFSGLKFIKFVQVKDETHKPLKAGPERANINNSDKFHIFSTISSISFEDVPLSHFSLVFDCFAREPAKYPKNNSI